MVLRKFVIPRGTRRRLEGRKPLPHPLLYVAHEMQNIDRAGS